MGMNAGSARTLVCLMMSASAVIWLETFPAVAAADEAHPSHWTYSGAESPAHWGDLDPGYAACSHGHAQSPINIVNAQPADLPPLAFNYAPTPLNIIDNGHSLQITVAPGSTLTVGDKTFVLKQFHFHHPSEEHVNGKTFPLVAHLVHQDADGHLAVVAVLFEQGEANPLIDSLWHNIPDEKNKPREIPSVSLRVPDILPAKLGYFTYAGSLTTPPCTEGVTWYVLKSHPTVSAQQIATFAKIYPADARPVQPRNGRSILQSK
jgi:carbonic anhydrase